MLRILMYLGYISEIHKQRYTRETQTLSESVCKLYFYKVKTSYSLSHPLQSCPNFGFKITVICKLWKLLQYLSKDVLLRLLCSYLTLGKLFCVDYFATFIAVLSNHQLDP